MAIYHFTSKIIGRSAGRSSVAAAAYRSGTRMMNEYDGLEHDYRRKNWVVHSEILLPDNAPAEYANRDILWNEVEKIEKSPDAQLARELEVALPNELSLNEQIEVVNKFVIDNFVTEGMCIDYSIHNPPVTNDRRQPIDEQGNPTKDKEKMQFINPHAHIMLTMRPIDENGKWEQKSKVEYLCLKGGEEKGFTKDEIKGAIADGWQKQYRYTNESGKKVWLPSIEGEQRGLSRVNRTPKTSPYGRKNEKVERWNSVDSIFKWRKNWELIVNKKLEEIKSEARIDCRSFKERGRGDEIPTVHMGTSAAYMEKRAERELREGKSEADVKHSDIAELNKEIKAYNQFIRELKAKVELLVKKSKDLLERAARKLESIRARLIGNQYRELVFKEKYGFTEKEVMTEWGRVNQYQTEKQQLEDANTQSAKRIDALKGQLSACNPLQLDTKTSLKREIQNEQEAIESRNEYQTKLLSQYGFKNEQEFADTRDSLFKKKNEFEHLEMMLAANEQSTMQLIDEYKVELNTIEKNDEVEKARLQIRRRMEDVIAVGLAKKDKLNIELYSNAVKAVDFKLKKVADASGKKEIIISKERGHSK